MDTLESSANGRVRSSNGGPSLRRLTSPYYKQSRSRNSISPKHTLSPYKKAAHRSSHSNSPFKSPKATKSRPDDSLPMYIMELPSVEHQYECPECSYTTFKRANFIHHTRSVHSMIYEIFYQCVGCKKQYEQIRECMAHTTTCKQIQKNIDVQEKRNTRTRRHDELESNSHLFKRPKVSSINIEFPLKIRTNRADTTNSGSIALSPQTNDSTDEPQVEVETSEQVLNGGDGSNQEIVFYVPVPRKEIRLICPVCSREFTRKDRTVAHFNREHSDINWKILYQCIYCDETYDDWPECQSHLNDCKKEHGANTIQPKAVSHSTPNNKTIAKPSIPKKIAPPKKDVSHSGVDVGSRPSWEMLFFTELGRSLVQNQNSAESLVRVVPQIREIVKQVVAGLGHSTV